ncbi:MAG: hypothetical protein Q8P56_01100 [Candidatus Uhrbacteria bacterium]|nr:hypothetical protein [Candidatus Uhrbacteria bacterium]
MESQKKTILFWALVVGFFLIIFLLWFPQFVGSVKTLTTVVQTQSIDQSSSFQNEWKARSEEIKKNFDTLLQQANTITNTANDQSGVPQSQSTTQDNSGVAPTK